MEDNDCHQSGGAGYPSSRVLVALTFVMLVTFGFRIWDARRQDLIDYQARVDHENTVSRAIAQDMRENSQRRLKKMWNVEEGQEARYEKISSYIHDPEAILKDFCAGVDIPELQEYARVFGEELAAIQERDTCISPESWTWLKKYGAKSEWVLKVDIHSAEKCLQGEANKVLVPLQITDFTEIPFKIGIHFIEWDRESGRIVRHDPYPLTAQGDDYNARFQIETLDRELRQQLSQLKKTAKQKPVKAFWEQKSYLKTATLPSLQFPVLIAATDVLSCPQAFLEDFWSTTRVETRLIRDLQRTGALQHVLPIGASENTEDELKSSTSHLVRMGHENTVFEFVQQDRVVNAYLRDASSASSTSTSSDFIAKIDDLFQDMPLTKKTIYLFRGTAPDRHHQFLVPEYMFSTPLRNIAQRYGSVFNVLEIPPGTPILAVDGLSDIPSLREVVLPRNGKLQLVNKYESPVSDAEVADPFESGRPFLVFHFKFIYEKPVHIATLI